MINVPRGWVFAQCFNEQIWRMFSKDNSSMERVLKIFTKYSFDRAKGSETWPEAHLQSHTVSKLIKLEQYLTVTEARMKEEGSGWEEVGTQYGNGNINWQSVFGGVSRDVPSVKGEYLIRQANYANRPGWLAGAVAVPVASVTSILALDLFANDLAYVLDPSGQSFWQGMRNYATPSIVVVA